MIKINKTQLTFLVLLLVGLVLRLYHIEFGLPHSFYADEPEFAELAIKYTYELRDIVGNGNFYKLIPISYVYGTLPTYMLTLAVMAFSKINNLLAIPFDKTSLFIFQRVITAIISTLIILAGSLLYKAKFNKGLGGFIAAGLIAFNWKLIAHGHYVNADIFLTLFLTLSVYFLLRYYREDTPSKLLIFSAVLFGAAVGTKVTALITLPLHLWLIFIKKDYRGFVAYCFIILGIFAITNPYSLIFADDFIGRIINLSSKEAGLVFDSVDLSYTKYITALGFIATPAIFIISLYGMYKSVVTEKDRVSNFLLIGYVLIYISFFTLQTRRIDRWLLPILPITLVYCACAIEHYLINNKFRTVQAGTIFLAGIYYLAFTWILLTQFNRHTPKSAAYVWSQENLPATSTKLAYTEEGLDPLNKLPYARVHKYEVYASENAQFFLPEDPELYDYVIISSRPMENFKKDTVRASYPFYSDRWEAFEETLQDPEKFELIKDFTLNKPNLIPLSDVYIYKNL